MKRISLALLIVLVTTTLAACGGGSKKSTPTPTTTTSSATSTGTATASATGATPTAGTSSGSATPTQSTGSATTTPSAQGTQSTQTATGATATAPAPPPQANTASGKFAYGFNAFVRGDANGAAYNKQTIDMIKGAGFDWIRIPIRWSDYEPQKGAWNPLPMDRIVDQFQGSNVKILATLTAAPDWAVDSSGQHFLKNYQDFAAFAAFVVNRYKGKIDAWEMWNEQNIAANMGGIVRIQDYASLLQAGYQGAKQADPNSVVLFGGLTPTGVTNTKIAYDDAKYLEAFYDYQNGAFTKYFDVMGMHVNATNNPPDKMYPDNPGTGNWSKDPSFYFRRAEQLEQVMAQHRDNRPVWITEFGWTTANQAKGYEYGKDVTPQDQANYLVGAFKWAHDNWPWVTGMFVWNLNYSTITPPSDEKYPWSVLNADWSPRPAYTALRNMPK